MRPRLGRMLLSLGEYLLFRDLLLYQSRGLGLELSLGLELGLGLGLGLCDLNLALWR